MTPVVQISLDSITPLHAVRAPRKLSELVTSMRENGWQGRPLLLIGRSSDYLAWTGSHRIEAAKKAGLKTVPCYVVQESALKRHGLDAEHGHVDDSDRLQAIRQIGDEGALHIMWQEGRD